MTNVSAGTQHQTRACIEACAVPMLVELLKSHNNDIKEQAIWALGNIAGDSSICRDFVLSHDAMNLLLKIIMETSKLSMLRIATWTLSNFCRSKPPPIWNYINSALNILAQLIYSTDEEILSDACWTLSYLSDGPNDRIQSIIDAGVCGKVVALLM